jgi:2-keto-4-pentenoate hydratase/2-oxohepta-3-ene-1,7-dioic acid hydratase in catechol pathway
MKLLSFRHRGADTWGALSPSGDAVDLQQRTEGRIRTLKEAIAKLPLAEIERLAQAAGPGVPLREIEFLPVIPDAGKILCIGLNYDAHRVEANRAVTTSPTIFVRFACSQVGHGAPLVVPRESTQFDYEGEIAVVIGQGGRRIAEQDAWSHVAGYAPYNDGSVRDWQAHTTQWTAGKNFSGTGAFGPWMVTRGEIADGARLDLVTRLNGQEMQRGHTDQLIFTIPRLIAYISTFTPLEPGDVIVTGTPSGVGFKRTPPVFMRPGDTVEVEVSGLGTLANRVIAEGAAGDA